MPERLLERAPLSRGDPRRSLSLISKGELALTLSHLKAAQGAYRHLLRTGGTAALVLEEDVDLSPLDVYNRTLSEWAEAALGADWLVASLGSSISRPEGWTQLADAAEPKQHLAYRRRSSSPLAAKRNRSSPEAGVWGTFAVMYSIEGLRLLLGADGSRTATFAQVSRMTVDVVSDVYIYAALRASSWIAVPPLVIVAAGEHDILDINSSSTRGSHSPFRVHAERGARKAISVMAAALPSGCSGFQAPFSLPLPPSPTFPDKIDIVIPHAGAPHTQSVLRSDRIMGRGWDRSPIVIHKSLFKSHKSLFVDTSHCSNHVDTSHCSNHGVDTSHCSNHEVPAKFKYFADVVQILQEVSVNYYVGSGTALHFWRECSLNDSDLDFFVDLEDMRNNYNALVTEFERRNWKKAREFGVFGKPLWEFAFVHRVSDLKVDLFSFTHSKTKGLYYSGLTVEHKSYPCKEYVRQLRQYEWNGVVFTAPDPITTYLAKKYGNWEKKRKSVWNVSPFKTDNGADSCQKNRTDLSMICEHCRTVLSTLRPRCICSANSTGGVQAANALNAHPEVEVERLRAELEAERSERHQHARHRRTWTRSST